MPRKDLNKQLGTARCISQNKGHGAHLVGGRQQILRREHVEERGDERRAARLLERVGAVGVVELRLDGGRVDAGAHVEALQADRLDGPGARRDLARATTSS